MISPKVTVTRSFTTTDQTVFADRYDAEKHQSGLALMNMLMAEGFENRGELKKICTTITSKFPKFAGLFDSVRRTHRNQNDAKAKKAKGV